MRPRGRQVALAGALTGVLFLLGADAWGQPPGSIPPVYVQRLQVPVLGDAFAQPSAVVADGHTGEIFVTDRRSNRIVIFDAKGRFRYLIPGGTSFQSPIDLAVDPEGYLFVLGQISPEITLLDFDGRLIRKFPLAGLPQGLESPRFTSLAMSPSGDTLYLIDSANDRLWIASRDGTVRRSIDMTIDRPQEQIDMLRYGHIDVYGETLLVPVPTDGMVYLYDLDGDARGSVGALGSAACQTMFPAAAALDDQGRVLILDQQRSLFMTWDLARNVCLSEHYGFGNVPGAFYQPSDLALDGNGRLYVSQGFEGRIQVYEGAQPAAMRLAAREPSSAPEETASGDLTAIARKPIQEATATEEERVVSALEPSPIRVSETPAPPEEALEAADESPAEFGALIAAGAILSVERAPRYDPTYAEIGFPGGDLPFDRGAAVDLVVRALRHAGLDLQEAVHEDILDAPQAYEINELNPNIDHRRIRNLVTFFDRNARSLSIGTDANWAPGDLVLWDRNSDGLAGHIGVLTAEIGPSGNPLVVHHHRPDRGFAGTPAMDDVLFRWPVMRHYRWSLADLAAASTVEPAAVRTIERPTPEEVLVAAGETPAEFGTLVAAGAILSVERGPRYDPTYTEIAFPGGDLPLDRGAAVDVVVRALRHAGLDLQEAVHRDILDAPRAYGVDEPNPNIDHRRIRNLVAFFDRNATSLSTSTDANWAPGDLVFWDRNSDGLAGHLGVLTAETGSSGNPLVVHHHRPDRGFDGTPAMDDVLLRWPVIRHYRWSVGTEPVVGSHGE